MDGMGIGIPLQLLAFPIVIIRNMHLFMVTLSYGEEKRCGGIGSWYFAKTLWWTGNMGYVWYVYHIIFVLGNFWNRRSSWIHYAYMCCFLTVRCWHRRSYLSLCWAALCSKNQLSQVSLDLHNLPLKHTGHLKPTVWKQRQYRMGRLLATWEFSR